MNTMLLKYLSIFGVILLSAFGALADFFLKSSGNGEKYIRWNYFLAGFILYSSLAFGWFFLMKHIKLASIGVIYSLCTLILLALIGVLYFKESLSVSEWIGIILGGVAIALLAGRA